jgi:hypothetical protein
MTEGTGGEAGVSRGELSGSGGGESLHDLRRRSVGGESSSLRTEARTSLAWASVPE